MCIYMVISTLTRVHRCICYNLNASRKVFVFTIYVGNIIIMFESSKNIILINTIISIEQLYQFRFARNELALSHSCFNIRMCQ